jgi:hypothetical protein
MRFRYKVVFPLSKLWESPFPLPKSYLRLCKRAIIS